MRLQTLLAPMMLSVTIGAAGAQEPTITAHGIAIFGELRLPADFDHLPYVNPDAPKGGSISQSVPNSSNFDSFNPYTFKGRVAVLSSVALEGLFDRDADDFGASYCLICSTIEYPESRDWVIFNLRPEAKFSDGTPLTAEDVQFSYETLRDQSYSGLRLMISQQIAGAEVLDPHRIKFYFTPDYPRREIIQFAGGLPVFSRQDFLDNKRNLAETMTKPLLGSGPYRITDFVINRSVTATRNPDYWGEALPINKGRHNFDRITYEYFADYDAAFEAFKAGEYTFRHEVKSSLWATGYNFPALQKAWVVQEAVPDRGPVSGQAWIFNMRRDKFKDPRVREAIGLMFNFEWTNETLFHGLYRRVQSFWQNQALEAKGPPPADELALLQPLARDLPPEVLTGEAFLWPEGSRQQSDRRQVLRAAQLLDEAGWVAGTDGMRRNKRGEVLRIEFLNDSPDSDRILGPFVANLRKLGIDAVNYKVDNAESEARENSFNFDITQNWLGQTPIPGAEMWPTFGSANAGAKTNLSGMANPAIDALIHRIEGAGTEQELEIAARAMDRALRAIKPWVPQWYTPDRLLAYYDIYEHPETLPKYALGELDFWWYNADKAEKLKQAGALR